VYIASAIMVRKKRTLRVSAHRGGIAKIAGQARKLDADYLVVEV